MYAICFKGDGFSLNKNLNSFNLSESFCVVDVKETDDSSTYFQVVSRSFLLYLDIDIQSTQPLHDTELCDKMCQCELYREDPDGYKREKAAAQAANCLNPFIHTTVFKFQSHLCPFKCSSLFPFLL